MSTSTATTMQAVLVGEADDQLLTLLTDVAASDMGIELARAVDAADLRGSTPDLLLVALHRDTPVPHGLVESIRSMCDAPIAALADRVDASLLERAASAGIADVVLADQDPKLMAFAFRRATTFASGARTTGNGLGRGRGARVVTTMSLKGGTGASTVAVNLAAQAASAGVRTLLLDLDLSGGDAALALGLSPTRTIADVTMSSGDLDADKLRGHVERHASGLDVLAAPASSDDAALVRAERIREVLQAARDGWELVVVDTGHVVDEHLVAALDACDELLVLTTPCVGGVRAARRALDTAEALDVARGAMRVVLNRAGVAGGLSAGDVAGTIDRPVVHRVPDDRAVAATWNQGVPVALDRPSTAAARALAALTAELVPSIAGTVGTRRPRLSLRRSTGAVAAPKAVQA